MRARPMIRRLRWACLAAGFAFGGGLPAGDADAAGPAARNRITSACSDGPPCRRQAGPGPADRDVHPFEGSLGRPCAYRRRETPSGPRRVRVCF